MSIKTMEGYCRICRENVTVEKKKPKQRNVFSNIVFFYSYRRIISSYMDIIINNRKKDMALHSM